MTGPPGQAAVPVHVVPCEECGGTGRQRAAVGWLPLPCDYCGGLGVRETDAETALAYEASMGRTVAAA